ncbi:putative internalin (LPXTG motif) [Streptococcus sp. DD12]|nr:putative internalin (LPXTG motif) [Streptococcus sp. DD12]
MAYVDYDSLDSAEKAQVRQLDANEAVKSNWRYKLVYAKDQTPESSPSSNASTPSATGASSATSPSKPQEGFLPETGEKTIAGLSLIGLVCIGGALFLVFRRKTTSAKGLLLVLAATGALGLGTSVAKAYSGTVLKEAELVATDTVITPPAIAGYHYVGALSIPSGTVIAHYVDTEGNTIADSVTVADEADVDTDYTTEQKTIEGYQFKEMATGSAATTGKVIDGTQTVTYVYEKVGTYRLNLALTIDQIIPNNGFSLAHPDNLYGDIYFRILGAPVVTYKGQVLTPTITADKAIPSLFPAGSTYRMPDDYIDYYKYSYSYTVFESQGPIGSPITYSGETAESIEQNLIIHWNGVDYTPTAFAEMIRVHLKAAGILIDADNLTSGIKITGEGVPSGDITSNQVYTPLREENVNMSISTGVWNNM